MKITAVFRKRVIAGKGFIKTLVCEFPHDDHSTDDPDTS